MGEKKSLFNKVTNAILKHNFKLNEVKDLTLLKSISYSKENLVSLQKILKQKKLDDLDRFQEGTMSEEILILLTFRDEQNNQFTAIVYDNDLLWQDENVLYIYPI